MEPQASLTDASVPHSSHWGVFRARASASGGVEVSDHELDPAPSPLTRNIEGAIHHRARIDRPYVRKGWLEGRERSGADRRGRDAFVAVDWETAIELVATELRRVYGQVGAPAVFGGSYGWSSAGRFHHAQSHIHRFLNCLGGYTRSVNSYSLGAAGVIGPHVVGQGGLALSENASTWTDLIGNCELMVCFGGLPTRNAAVAPGGLSQHTTRANIRSLADAGCEFVNISPMASDLPDVEAEWAPIRPNTDVAMMLAIAHELIVCDRVDTAFLQEFSVGYEAFADYVLGVSDGLAKDAEWASEICDIAAPYIRALALRMSERATFVTVLPSLQRAEHGEQPIWMGIVLAAMLGGIGLPGRGFGCGFGTFGNVGNAHKLLSLPSVPQGRNLVQEFIPVARIADMLLGPGEKYEYDGQLLTYPEIRLIYWAGGNPFHHHQDLFRLSDAFQRPETVIVHEPFWTATAKHADIVLPVTVTVERNDFGAANHDPFVVAMKKVIEPFGQSLDDYEIFARLAERLGVGEQYTEGRSVDEWLRHMYEDWRTRAAAAGADVDGFDSFWARGHTEAPRAAAPYSWLQEFREDPVGRPLATPSGKIEVFSDTISSFGYDDCPGHPAWLEPDEWLGGEIVADYPFALIANQPRGRLHSQLDMGAVSEATRSGGREQLTLNTDDARRLGITQGTVVAVESPRGRFIAVARPSDSIRRGVVQVATGAWLDPDWETRTCVHGNPNVVTRDAGTSRLAQGSTGQLCHVRVRPLDEPAREVACFDPPAVVESPGNPVGQRRM